MAEPSVETYTAPPHGWTCFHCGETFKTYGSARDHFGVEPTADLACRIKVGEELGLVMALRKAEAALDARDKQLAEARAAEQESVGLFNEDFDMDEDSLEADLRCGKD